MVVIRERNRLFDGSGDIERHAFDVEKFAVLGTNGVNGRRFVQRSRERAEQQQRYEYERMRKASARGSAQRRAFRFDEHLLSGLGGPISIPSLEVHFVNALVRPLANSPFKNQVRAATGFDVTAPASCTRRIARRP